jgi:threonine aldolase
MSMPLAVDLFSDTQTRPSAEMRAFMAEADVGDEQLGEDPTVNSLQGMVAELLGKEAAVYLPSGAMCNQISFAVHCRPGDEIIMDRTAHPLIAEAGGVAALTGALVSPLDGKRGIFTADQVEGAVQPPSRYSPRTRAVSIEQTTNLGGGACWPLATVRAVRDVAKAHGLASHLDGARLMNAVVATGVPARDFTDGFDSSWIDLSKGLGAPVGAVLAGSTAFIEEAWLFKQRMGGAMRQAGIIAAAGIYALRNNVERLADDHVNAKALAEGLAEIPGIEVDPETVETNIVLFDVSGTGLGATEFSDRMIDEHGVRFSQMTRTLLRGVTHIDVSKAGVETAIHAAREVVENQ